VYKIKLLKKHIERIHNQDKLTVFINQRSSKKKHVY